jgi:hypothetical protein
LNQTKPNQNYSLNFVKETAEPSHIDLLVNCYINMHDKLLNAYFENKNRSI